MSSADLETLSQGPVNQRRRPSKIAYKDKWYLEDIRMNPNTISITLDDFG